MQMPILVQNMQRNMHNMQVIRKMLKNMQNTQRNMQKMQYTQRNMQRTLKYAESFESVLVSETAVSD
jgi:hypothetical protein